MKYLLAIFFLAPILIRAQTTLSLSECAALLEKNNLLYRQGQLQTEEAEASLRQTRSQRLPQISIGSTQSMNLGRSIDQFTNNYVDQFYNYNYVGVGADMPIFKGFQIQNQIRQNELLKDAAAENQAAVLNSQKILLMQGYANVLASKDLHEAAVQQSDASRQQVDRVSKQLDAGVVSESTLLEIKAQLASDRFDEVTALNRYRAARLALFQLLNLPPDDQTQLAVLGELPAITAENNTEEIYRNALQLFPELRSADLRLKSYAYQVKSIKSLNYPSLSLSASFGAFYASTNTDLGYMQQLNATRNGGLSLNLSIPIMGRWVTRPRIETAQVQERIAQNSMNISRQQLRQQIEQALLDANAARDSYALAQSQVEFMQAGFAVAESKLNAGTANVFEYSVAKSRLATAQANKIRSHYELLMRQRLLYFYRQGNWDGIL